MGSADYAILLIPTDTRCRQESTPPKRGARIKTINRPKQQDDLIQTHAHAAEPAKVRPRALHSRPVPATPPRAAGTSLLGAKAHRRPARQSKPQAAPRQGRSFFHFHRFTSLDIGRIRPVAQPHQTRRRQLTARAPAAVLWPLVRVAVTPRAADHFALVISASLCRASERRPSGEERKSLPNSTASRRVSGFHTPETIKRGATPRRVHSLFSSMNFRHFRP